MNFPFHNDMISPSSAETKDRLKNASSFGDFLKRNRENMLEADLSKYLMELLAQKGLKRAQVVEDSGVDKAFVYQIFNGSKRPSRDKLIAITFGMHLNEEETQRVLKIAGHRRCFRRSKDSVPHQVKKPSLPWRIGNDDFLPMVDSRGSSLSVSVLR